METVCYIKGVGDPLSPIYTVFKIHKDVEILLNTVDTLLYQFMCV